MANDTTTDGRDTLYWVLGAAALAVLLVVGLGLLDNGGDQVQQPDTAPGQEEELAEEQNLTENQTALNDTTTDETVPGDTTTGPTQ